jgi:HTH-type transcriptional regulator / antitoxin HigA
VPTTWPGRVRAVYDGPFASPKSVTSFFGVASPDLWDPGVAYRKSRRFQSDPYALAAWLRPGELEAAEIETEPYASDSFLDALAEIEA